MLHRCPSEFEAKGRRTLPNSDFSGHAQRKLCPSSTFSDKETEYSEPGALHSSLQATSASRRCTASSTATPCTTPKSATARSSPPRPRRSPTRLPYPPPPPGAPRPVVYRAPPPPTHPWNSPLPSTRAIAPLHLDADGELACPPARREFLLLVSVSFHGPGVPAGAARAGDELHRGDPAHHGPQRGGRPFRRRALSVTR